MKRAWLALALLGVTATLQSCSSEKTAPSASSTPASGSSTSGGSCPTNCDDGNACTFDQMVDCGCSSTPITACTPGDACCPAGCDPATDTDCSQSCDNGRVDAGETCDPPSSCPASCDDGDPCTLDQMTGSAVNCNVACSNSPMAGCEPTTTTGIGGSTTSAGGATSTDGATSMGGATSTDSASTVDGGGAGGTGGMVTNACSDAAPSGNAPNTLMVDAGSAETVINKEIFGVLMERLGRGINDGLFVGTNSSIPNTNGMRNDIVEGFIEAGVGMIQWPGGCAGNNYNWQPPNPSNDLGTDRYMELCAMVGVKPYLTGGGTASAAQRNLDWITYINDNSEHPEWELNYFKVGNEVWGCGGDQDESTYRGNYQANYDLLSTPINDKELTLVAGNDLIGNFGWLDTQLGAVGDIIDGIEIHDYLYFPDTIPCVGFSDNQYYDIINRANQGQIGPRIDEIVSILDEHDPGNRIKIFLDEWGDWLIGFNESQDTWLQQITLMDAISSAEHLHQFMSHADRIFMAAVAQPINVIHSLFLTSPDDGTLVKTPAFYVFKMFAPHHTNGAMWAPHTLDSENINGNNQSFPVISAGTSVDSAGRVNVSLANVDLTGSRTIDITVNGGASSYVASQAEVITGPEKDSYNDFGQPEVVNIQPLASSECTVSGSSLSVTLPAKSVVMVRLVPQ